VNKGRGTSMAEQHPVDRTLAVDVVRVDSIYNPVTAREFHRGGRRASAQRTDYDRLTLTVETNGTISPEDAVAYGRGARAGALPLLPWTSAKCRSSPASRRAGQWRVRGAGCGTCWGAHRRRRVSVRSVNSLKNSKSDPRRPRPLQEDDLLKVEECREKALGEIAELLRREV